MKEDIPVVFGLLGENENEKTVADLWAERVLCASNMYFTLNYIHKEARMARSRDFVEIKSMIDFVLVEKVTLKYVYDMKTVRVLERSNLAYSTLQNYLKLGWWKHE